MSDDLERVMTALRAERKVRKTAEQDADRARVELAQARGEMRQLRADLDRAVQRGDYWKRRANGRGKALAAANQTTHALAVALTKGMDK